MASDRTILHLVKKKNPRPLPPLSRIMTCTLLILSYAPGCVQEYIDYIHSELTPQNSNSTFRSGTKQVSHTCPLLSLIFTYFLN